MKKLLVAAIGAAAAIGAFADTPKPITELRFESADFVVGETNSVEQLNTNHGGTYWTNSVSAADNAYVIESAGAVTSPKPLGNVTKALNVKTKFGNPLSVNVVNGGEAQTIGADGIYFDSLVKFTVCDDCPTNEYSGAKIVMWLQEDEDLHKTNLYVNAGFLSCDNQGRVVVSNAIYKCGTTIGPDFADAWHRVTIKAIANITTSTSTSVPGFAIFIDGSGANATKAECTSAKWDTSFTDVFEFAEAVELLKVNSLFPSLIQGASGASLSKASFDGTGSITDIAFYDASPDTFADDYVAPKAVITVNDEPYGSETGEYTDLAGAIAVLNSIAAAEAAEVKFTLQRDVAFDGNLTINNLDEKVTIIIDLAGKELTVGKLFFKSPVTITDSSEGRTGVIIGDIYVDREDAAGEMTLLAGTIDGYIDGTYEEEVAVYKKSVFLTGGTVKQNDIEPVDGYVLEQVGETDFYNVVEYVAPTYTITVAGGEHFTVAVTTNEVAAGAAGAYVVTEGDSVAVTYTADTGYTLSKYEDGIPTVSETATIAAPVATLQTFNVIFVDGDSATTNVVDYGTTLTAESAPAFVGRTGYTAAWDKTVAGTIVTAETTFTAMYTGKTFTIATYTNGVFNTSKEFTYAGASVDPANPLYNTETETWDGKWYTTAGGSTEFAFDAAGELTQNAYATIETKGGSVVPDIPAGGETDCGTAEAAAAAADAINKDAASKAAHIKVPTGADAGTYLGYVEAVAVGTKVTVDFTTAGAAAAQTSANTDVVSEAVSAAVAAAAAAGSEGSGTASVSTVAGFYYSIVSGTSPTAVTTEGTRVLGTGGSVNLTVPNKGPAGFYKVKVSARAAD